MAIIKLIVSGLIPWTKSPVKQMTNYTSYIICTICLNSQSHYIFLGDYHLWTNYLNVSAISCFVCCFYWYNLSVCLSRLQSLSVETPGWASCWCRSDNKLSNHTLRTWAGVWAELPDAVPLWKDQEHLHLIHKHGTRCSLVKLLGENLRFLLFSVWSEAQLNYRL